MLWRQPLRPKNIWSLSPRSSLLPYCSGPSLQKRQICRVVRDSIESLLNFLSLPKSFSRHSQIPSARSPLCLRLAAYLPSNLFISHLNRSKIQARLDRTQRFSLQGYGTERLTVDSRVRGNLSVAIFLLLYFEGCNIQILKDKPIS